MRKEAINIESDLFASMRNDFDEVLSGLLAGMARRGVGGGTVTLKLSISNEQITDGNGVVRNYPRFAHKIKSKVSLDGPDAEGETKECVELYYDDVYGQWRMLRSQTVFDSSGEEDSEDDEEL